MNKILIELKFVGHKILKTLDYLVKFELIPKIEVKQASKKIQEQFQKIV